MTRLMTYFTIYINEGRTNRICLIVWPLAQGRIQTTLNLRFFATLP